MDHRFLIQCFFIGVLAASGCGPIFVLTFNRAAVCGFWKGFSTALGASIGDSSYFMLGLLGALTVIKEAKYFIFFLDIIGGIILLSLGVNSLKKMQQVVCVSVECSFNIFFSFFKSFSLTIFNPLVFLYFMAAVIHVLPEKETLSWGAVSLSSFAVCLGSLAVLCTVSLIAAFLGSCITAKRLRLISGFSGIVFIGVGLYLLSDFGINIVRLLI